MVRTEDQKRYAINKRDKDIANIQSRPIDHLVSTTTGMSPHQVVFGEPYNNTNRNNLRKYMEIMERIRHDVKKRSIATKAHQSIQYDKNKKERAFATGNRVNVQYFKGPFTVEELRSTFGHTDPEQSMYLKESRNDIGEKEDTEKGDNVCSDRKDDRSTGSPNQTLRAQALPSTTHNARPQSTSTTTALPTTPTQAPNQPNESTDTL
eukprot:TRINITY_DN962_c0_g5_i1.p1 TRINITY_DN962_c0_g5~~TRINITY_DN962_c0_g5_i1.p1  ORF type:complete len:207 (+),score=1.73 TRINITY_DN962_c0_g5_i1:415-1035(+)